MSNAIDLAFFNLLFKKVKNKIGNIITKALDIQKIAFHATEHSMPKLVNNIWINSRLIAVIGGKNIPAIRKYKVGLVNVHFILSKLLFNSVYHSFQKRVRLLFLCLHISKYDF